MKKQMLFQSYWQLARADKPIGYWLLFWPTMWALWVSYQGMPPLSMLFVCTLGVLLARSAGCIINDFADRDIDALVTRTASRPLAMKRLTSSNALVLFVVLIFLALCLAVFLGWAAVKMAMVAFVLMVFYPYCKRFFVCPQLILGLAFSWSILVVWAASGKAFTPQLLWLFLANMLWTIGYDTLYAMGDKSDDLGVGIHSFAIWLGGYDWFGVCACYLAFACCWLVLLFSIQPNIGCMLCSGVAGLHCLALVSNARTKEGPICFRSFLMNAWVGLWLWLALVFQYY